MVSLSGFHLGVVILSLHLFRASTSFLTIQKLHSPIGFAGQACVLEMGVSNRLFEGEYKSCRR